MQKVILTFLQRLIFDHKIGFMNKIVLTKKGKFVFSPKTPTEIFRWYICVWWFHWRFLVQVISAALVVIVAGIPVPWPLPDVVSADEEHIEALI